MKITRLSTFIVPPRWCFLKIETDEGIHGWGEPVVEGRAHATAAYVEELADYLIGKDPRLIEDHWTSASACIPGSAATARPTRRRQRGSARRAASPPSR
jgi:L-alanine-DL-glutamate epimerase-like enolase superfamily enzyme